MDHISRVVGRYSGLRENAPTTGTLRALVIVLLAMFTALATFLVLIGVTPLQPTARVTIAAIVLNGALVSALIALVGMEIRALIAAKRDRKAASRLHVRIVTLFSIVATIPAIVVAIVAAVTLDLGLDRWFEQRTRTIVESSAQVAQSYINENAINLRDSTITMAFAVDSQRIMFNLDRTGFRNFLTQQARGRGMLGASVIRGDGQVVHSADISVERPLPLAPQDALEDAKSGQTVVIPPGVTNLVGAIVKLREIPDAYLYTIRTVDARVLDAVQLMAQNRNEYQTLEGDRGIYQFAFALLYFGLALILLLGAIWTAIAVANRLVRPIRQLINAAGEVGKGNLEVRVPIRATDGDVGYLGETFNNMLGQLKGQRDQILLAKDQIDERRRFSEAVLSGVSAGVLGVSDDGIVTSTNRSVSSILGMSEPVSLGTKLSGLSPQLSALLDETLKGRNRSNSKQISFVDKFGRERVINVQIAVDNEPISRGGTQHHTHVVTLDDISDLVDAQRSSAWADVARRIAHEIKNPLTPIQLSAERIRRRYGKKIEEDDRAVFDQCTDTIIRQVGDIGRMVDEFSSFARMPKPTMKIRDLRETVREAAFLVEVSRAEYKFERNEPDTPVLVRFDDRMLGQAIGNVIKNASESIEGRLAVDPASGEGHIQINTYSGKDGAVIIDVIDNGKGLPREDRNKLLEPYITTRDKGTGLGLAIVKKIIEEHGGRLELLDAPAEFHGGRGACIRFVLPAANNDEAQATADTGNTAVAGEGGVIGR